MSKIKRYKIKRYSAKTIHRMYMRKRGVPRTPRLRRYRTRRLKINMYA